jgi:nucleoside-diphosphate-sugar epimerase
MMHVKDVAEALFKISNFRIQGIANIASMNNYKIFQLIAMIKNKNLRKKIILKNENKNYFFKKIIINKLRKICFVERFNIQSEIERMIK